MIQTRYPLKKQERLITFGRINKIKFRFFERIFLKDIDLDVYFKIYSDAIVDFERKNLGEDIFFYNKRFSDSWLGLSPDVLNTSYHDFRTILKYLNLESDKKIIDLGCGYGRMGLLIGKEFPHLKFEGFEYWPHRLEPALRASIQHRMKNVTFKVRDLLDTSYAFPKGDVYFVYLMSSSPTCMEELFSRIHEVSHPETIIITRKISEPLVMQWAPWLSLYHSIHLNDARIAFHKPYP